jgi:hypothetical protein
VLEAAGLESLLPKQKSDDDLDGLIETLKSKASDPEALKRILDALKK